MAASIGTHLVRAAFFGLAGAITVGLAMLLAVSSMLWWLARRATGPAPAGAAWTLLRDADGAGRLLALVGMILVILLTWALREAAIRRRIPVPRPVAVDYLLATAVLGAGAALALTSTFGVAVPLALTAVLTLQGLTAAACALALVQAELED
jgi:hypothetical protein